jgi:hypothetical protein
MVKDASYPCITKCSRSNNLQQPAKWEPRRVLKKRRPNRVTGIQSCNVTEGRLQNPCKNYSRQTLTYDTQTSASWTAQLCIGTYWRPAWGLAILVNAIAYVEVTLSAVLYPWIWPPHEMEYHKTIYSTSCTDMSTGRIHRSCSAHVRRSLFTSPRNRLAASTTFLQEHDTSHSGLKARV